MTYIRQTIITPEPTASTVIRNVDAVMILSGTTLRCQLWGDSGPVSLTGLTTGRIYPLQVKYVLSIGTAAATVIGFTLGRISQ